ncbi:hypothetical protein [Azospirillum argentinense]|uniref:Uncharacterized protein n=1 Tax=Azospirillum argentinense TaxID=2970906 RepID=A0A5B0KML5_9PROT|nr:hypothetical protein [Azospirillum argentinense]KAA1053917.1 hypothetical protein FH063_002499 [Azospirillum argentinense]
MAHPSKISAEQSAAFREIARELVQTDRWNRKNGKNQDFAGAIRRALEKAYLLGRQDSLDGSPHPAPEPNAHAPNAPMNWLLIPPRPREAFACICRWSLGGKVRFPDEPWPFLEKRDALYRNPYWVVFTVDTRKNVKPLFPDGQSYGDRTIQPLLKLGLLAEIDDAKTPSLMLTGKGAATWWQKVAESGDF